MCKWEHHSARVGDQSGAPFRGAQEGNWEGGGGGKKAQIHNTDQTPVTCIQFPGDHAGCSWWEGNSRGEKGGARDVTGVWCSSLT